MKTSEQRFQNFVWEEWESMEKIGYPSWFQLQKMNWFDNDWNYETVLEKKISLILIILSYDNITFLSCLFMSKHLYDLIGILL